MKPLEAPKFAEMLLEGVNGAPEVGSDMRTFIWRWMARQLEAWEQDIREDERKRPYSDTEHERDCLRMLVGAPMEVIDHAAKRIEDEALEVFEANLNNPYPQDRHLAIRYGGIAKEIRAIAQDIKRMAERVRR